MERINAAAARAVNALPADEAAVFDTEVATDRYLADHLESFRRVAVELVDGLPEIVPAASPDIWKRIVAETGIAEDETSSFPEDNIVPMKKRKSSALLAVVSLAAALFVGVAIGSVTAASEPSLRDAAVAAAAEPGSTSILMTNPDGIAAVNAEVVLTDDGTAYLLGESLPALTEERTYQLWLIVDDQIVSGALLGNDPEVVQFRAEGNVVGMAISNEVAGGVVMSEEAPTALWLQDA